MLNGHEFTAGVYCIPGNLYLAYHACARKFQILHDKQSIIEFSFTKQQYWNTVLVYQTTVLLNGHEFTVRVVVFLVKFVFYTIKKIINLLAIRHWIYYF